jgi:hypothetical protein
MVQINFARREVNCKIVYYGPGLSGKTTNLELVHEKVPKDRCGKLTSIATEGDRTLFFDFMPISLGKVAGMDTKFQLYTVPGQTFYESTRRLVLQGADGVVFVADSQQDKMEENVESFENLKRNLRENGLNIEEIPLVLQYNKRDLPGIADLETLNRMINSNGWPFFEAVAVRGDGVMQTLKAVSEVVLENLNTRHQRTRHVAKPLIEAEAPRQEAPQLQPVSVEAHASQEAEPAPLARVAPAAKQLPALQTRAAAAVSGNASHSSHPGPKSAAVGLAAGGIRTYGPREPHMKPKTRVSTLARDESLRARFAGKKSSVIWFTLAAIAAAAALAGLLLLII